MSAREYSDVWVCEDCYFAHHYGYTEFSGQFFAGDTDTPADREPLALLADFELADNVCSNHDGTDETACQYCGQTDYGTGENTFSWSRCDGCGSTLGGSRFRLALFESTNS